MVQLFTERGGGEAPTGGKRCHELIHIPDELLLIVRLRQVQEAHLHVHLPVVRLLTLSAVARSNEQHQMDE